MENFFISKPDFADFIKEISRDFVTFYLKEKPARFDWKQGKRKLLYWQKYDDNLEGLSLSGVRAQDSLKQFVFSCKEKVSDDFSDPKNRKKPVLLVCAKNCDLQGLDITDFVFTQGDFKDPFYIKKRQNMFIIASDCANPLETCFCLALDINPYPEKNYDLGLCDIKDGYIVEVATQRARNYIAEYKNKFSLASNAQLQRKKDVRDTASSDVAFNISKYGVPRKNELQGVVEKCFDSQIWKDEAKTCVECGSCNFICPTCHCFFLGDSKEENKNIRRKIWDACLYKDFA
ncbi:MAG: 4Fe-4S dicluster domain-containing protein, partial [Candidatus Omnitrophica bacterium]|nr:4Fe-4S dicluster domain-containing protein [Candidatus Omnitrophota bacterium]